MPIAQNSQEAKEIEGAIAREDWQEARSLVRPLLRRSPDDHWLLTRLGLTYYEQKRYKTALRYHVRALQIAPYCPLVIWDYAGALDALGQHKEALAIYRWMVAWDEEELANGPCGEGLRAARSLIADGYYRIGTILERKHQWKRAAAAYEEHLSRRTPGTRSIYPLRLVKQRYETLKSRKLESFGR
jgi:tetratricopeptide (TPR) repeat protein